LLHSFSLRDKLFLFVHKNKHQKLRATAIGIIWNRCVRDLAKIVLVETVEGASLEQVNAQWASILEDAFQDLREDVVDHLEELLQDQSLDEILELEMPDKTPHSPQGDDRKSSIPELLSSDQCWNGFMRCDSPDYSPNPSPSVSPKGSRRKSKHKHSRSHSHSSSKSKRASKRK